MPEQDLRAVLKAPLVAIFYAMLSITDFGCASMSGENVLVAINNCTCEGYDQIYECRITGSGATVWTGPAFVCSSNEITFLHGSSSTGAEITCNDGAIVGCLIRAENNTYVSQLTVSVSAQTVGTNISCSHDSTGTQLIGSKELTLTIDPYPPPDNVYLMEANFSQLVFQWSSVAPSCEAARYYINASNCGHCPNVTNDTTVTCTDFSLENQTCLLAVQTVVCDNITGDESRKIEVILRAPDAPEIDVIPTYSYNSKTLSRLTTRFNKTETFNITDGVDGSAVSYTIKYTISNSGAVCETDIETLASASCVNRSCEHDYMVSPSTCFSSSHINVTVSGTNILGSGPPSDPVTIPGRSDLFVDVSVDLASKTVTCLFHQQTENSENHCSIIYGPSRENCQLQNQRKILNGSISGSNVVFMFPLKDSEHFQPQEEYCFIVTASNGTFTAQIEGNTIILDTSTDVSMLGTVAAIAVFITIIAITLLGLVVTIFVIVKKKLKSVFSSETQFIDQSMTQRSANNDSEVEQQGLSETNEQGIGIYSLLQSVGDEPPASESQTKPHDPVYVDIGPSIRTTSQENTQGFLVPLCDDKVEYVEVKQLETEERKFSIDSKPDLDNLLIQIRDDVTPHWYEFGVTVGVPMEILNKCKDYPQDQCIVEVLDYWLVHHHFRLTWKDVAHALKEINLHHLAEYIIRSSKDTI